MVKSMTDPDWTEVEGTVGKIVYFTVYKADGVTVEDLSPYDEDLIQLKVWENDGTTLKFERNMTYVVDGTDGGLQATLVLGDIAIGDEGSHFFTIELEIEEANTATGVGTDTIFETNLDEANDYWNDFTIRFTAGDNEDEIRVITDYALANGEVTVDEAFTAAPGAGDTFVIERIVPTIRGTLQITQGAPA